MDVSAPSPRTRIDLNCDCGESFGAWTIGADAAVLPWVSSANIACGFHAGDAQTMLRTIDLCVQHGVSIGAHPGHRDLQGFGRRALAVDANDVYGETLYQIGALAALCGSRQTRLRHVKPHGALYHQLDREPALAQAFVAACAALDRSLLIYGPPDGQLLAAASSAGLAYVGEAFVERGYAADGRLLARGLDGAVLHDTPQIVEQARALALHGKVRGAAGEWIQRSADTLCIHGDRPDAAQLAAQIAAALRADGLQIVAPAAAHCAAR